MKIEGRADFHCSELLKKLVHGLLQQQRCSEILLDFGHCILMDSTFAGTLAGLGRELDKARQGTTPTPLGLLNMNQRVNDTLANLGVMRLFRALRQPAPDSREFKAVEPCPDQPDREGTTRLMLDAHRTLVEIDPANFDKFEDVIKYLEEDLKKLEGDSKASDPQPGA